MFDDQWTESNGGVYGLLTIREKYLILKLLIRKLDSVGSKRAKTDSVNRPIGMVVLGRDAGMFIMIPGQYVQKVGMHDPMSICAV